MFYPKAHGHIFLFHKNAGGKQRFNGVAAAVPDGKNHVRNLRGFRISARFFEPHGNDLAVFGRYALKLRAEKHLSAKAFHFRSQVFHNLRQAVAPDVRLGLDKDFLRRAESHQIFKNLALSFAADARVQLSVRERSRSAFAELNVGFGVQNFFDIKALNFFLSVVNGQASFHDDRLKPRAGQLKRSEHARRPEPHDQNRFVGITKILLRPAFFLRCFKVHFHRTGKMHVPFVPCVHRTPEHPKIFYAFRLHPRFFAGANLKLLRAFVEALPNFG